MRWILPMSVMMLLGLTSDAQMTFQNTYGDISTDRAHALVYTNDGGYCLAGSTGPALPDSTDIAIVRTNADGILLWSTRLTEIKDVYINGIVQTGSGGFMLTGTTFASPIDTAHSDILVIYVDDSGFFIWGFVFGGTGADEANAIVSVNGGFVILGNTQSFGSVQQSALAMKIDTVGNIVWSNVNSSLNVNTFSKGDAGTDGSIIAVGSTTNNPGNNQGSDYYIVKIDSTGLVQWGTRISSPLEDKGFDIKTLPSGYIMTGETYSATSGQSDASVIQLNNLGGVSWAYNYGTTEADNGTCLATSATGNIMVAGNTNIGDTNNVINQMFLQEMNPSGTANWTHGFGNFTGTSECNALAALPDGYALAGFTSGFSDPAGDMYLIKAGTSGWSGCFEGNLNFIRTAASLADSAGVTSSQPLVDQYPIIFNSTMYINQFGQNCFDNLTPENTLVVNWDLFPNPATHLLSLTSGYPVHKGIIKITDSSGRIISTHEFYNTTVIQVPIDHLDPGMYILQIWADDMVSHKTFIRQ